MAHEDIGSEPRRPRGWLALASVLHAAALGWVAWMVPYRDWTALSLLTGAVAMLHAATALAAILKHPRLPIVWRLQSIASVALLLYLGWGLLSSAWYVQALYRGLGQGVAAALVAVFGLVVLVTLPMACWGLAATGGVPLSKGRGVGLLIIVLLAAGRLEKLAERAVGAELVTAAEVATIHEALGRLDVAELAPGPRRASLMTRSPVPCPTRGRVRLVATYIERRSGRVRHHCVAGNVASDVVEQMVEHLGAHAARSPIKLDLLRSRADLPTSPLLASLAVRPGLDGVCALDAHHACLLPWMLVANDLLGEHQLLAQVPDARLGVSLSSLAEWVGSDALERVDTVSWLLDPTNGLREMGRTRRDRIEVNAGTLQSAQRAAQRYIQLAQHQNGRFRYVVDPHSGAVQYEPFSIARQAGTTLALCELGAPSSRRRQVVGRSLALLATLEQRVDRTDGAALSMVRYPADKRERTERFGPSALTLAALIRCRDLLDEPLDALSGRLLRALLALQREDGGFDPQLDLETGRGVQGGSNLFADGQAVLALVLAEAVASDQPGWPAPEVLHDAVERAMSYFGGAYWDGFLRPLWFMEENWHCIAAAAALEHHPHQAYERFCLDYVRFKGRLVHDEGDAVHDDFAGGYGFGNIVPPHNTATAGFGEALAAALTIERARGLDVRRDEARLRSVLGFLMRNQWQSERCYACSPKVSVIGGFSEHMASPKVRIDYVQHAWAALGHGARALGLAEQQDIQ